MENEIALLRRQVEDLEAEVLRLQQSENDREQALLLLVEKERLFSTLTDNLPGMAYRCLNDKFWTMKFVSDGCLPLTGFQPAYLLHNNRKSYNDLIHPHDQQMVRDKVQIAIENRAQFNLIYRIHSADGTIKWVMEVGQGIFSDTGDLLELVGLITDITDRGWAEEALRQSEEKFRLAFHTSPDAINLNRLSDGMYIDINEGFTKLTGYTREDAIGKTSLELNVWNDPEDRDSLVQLLMADGKAENLEARFKRKNGQVGFGLMSASLITINQEKIILSITRDITDRRQAGEILRETEMKYRELAESLPQVIFEVDLKGDLTYINRNAYALFGYSPEEVEKGFNILQVIVPEDRDRVAGDIIRNIEGHKLGRQEYTAVRKDGTRFPVGVHANSFQRGQNTTGVRGILIDLTESKRAEKEKKKLELQLQQAQKMEAIGALAGGIAHDFNNILSAIIGYTELAMLNENSKHCTGELNEALKAANRAKDLVKQILAFSRQTDEDLKPVMVGMVANEAEKFLRATIPTTIEIKTRIKENSGAVLANSVELHQIIMNLCTNAAHAIGDQTGILEIEVHDVEIDLAQKNDFIDLEIGPYVRISVKDTGHGIDPEVRKRIFDPYFTTKEKGVGTGLGLAVVHGIVKKYGGAINVESKLGEGTNFHIHFPRVSITSPIKAEQPKKIIGGSERILFVDDEKMLVEIGQLALQRLGYNVVSRTSPIEALELFKAKPDHFDLMITDQTMPGMTGSALAKEIMRIRPELPIIICTGYSQTIDPNRAADMGIKGFVMKPIIINDLAAAVRRALG